MLENFFQPKTYILLNSPDSKIKGKLELSDFLSREKRRISLFPLVLRIAGKMKIACL
jgi:hypothetical protein